MRMKVEKQSSDAEESTHSSEEAAVMVVERRDSVIYTSEIKQPEVGGFNERRKIV